MLEGLGGGDPLCRIHGQHLVDQVLGLRRHRVPLGRWILQRAQIMTRKLRRIKKGETHVIGTSFDLSVQPMLVLVPERRVAHQQDVQNHTCEKQKFEQSKMRFNAIPFNRVMKMSKTRFDAFKDDKTSALGKKGREN